MTICVCRTEIPDGGRSLSVVTTMRWGDDDLRDDAVKEAVFCSFGCLADWARDRSEAHDEVVLVEGEPARDGDGEP